MNFNELDFEIKTERLVLKQLVSRDVQSIFDIATTYPEITRFMSWSPPKKIEETKGFFKETEKKIKAGKLVRWGVFFEDEFIGMISIEGIVRKELKVRLDRGELGYWLSPKFEGNGYMTEAAKAVTDFSFNNLDLHKIIVMHVYENDKSKRVIEKSGFRHIGTQKSHVFIEKKWWDVEIYELLNNY